jgi:hypothetical protein
MLLHSHFMWYSYPLLFFPGNILWLFPLFYLFFAFHLTLAFCTWYVHIKEWEPISRFRQLFPNQLHDSKEFQELRTFFDSPWLVKGTVAITVQHKSTYVLQDTVLIRNISWQICLCYISTYYIVIHYLHTLSHNVMSRNISFSQRNCHITWYVTKHKSNNVTRH